MLNKLDVLLAPTFTLLLFEGGDGFFGSFLSKRYKKTAIIPIPININFSFVFDDKPSNFFASLLKSYLKCLSKCCSFDRAREP